MTLTLEKSGREKYLKRLPDRWYATEPYISLKNKPASVQVLE